MLHVIALAPGTRMSVAEAIQTALQIGKALQCLHELGILHKGLEPCNVLLDESGQAALAGFSRSCVVSATVGSDHEPPGCLPCTLNYM